MKVYGGQYLIESDAHDVERTEELDLALCMLRQYAELSRRDDEKFL